MRTEFSCPFCNSWIDKEKFSDHMKDHDFMGFDMCKGLRTIPNTYIEYQRRFAPLGLFQERSIEP